MIKFVLEKQITRHIMMKNIRFLGALMGTKVHFVQAALKVLAKLLRLNANLAKIKEFIF